jgi:hypothetical protein
MTKLKGNIYYGVEPTKRLQETTSKVEAAKTGNVKYFGAHKIDSRLLDEYIE